MIHRLVLFDILKKRGKNIMQTATVFAPSASSLIRTALGRSNHQRSLLLQHRSISQNNYNNFYEPEIAPADEDVNHMHTVVKKERLRVMTTVPGEYASAGTRGRVSMQIHAPITNHNQAHLQQQIRLNNPAFHHFEMLDSVTPGAIEGLWYYPFFFDAKEQANLQGDIAPLFRDPQSVMRVKNTCTLMRGSHAAAPGKDMSTIRHGWGERNHPSLGRVGRRNVAHISTVECAARKQNFADISATPSVAAAMAKVWEVFGAQQNSFQGEGEGGFGSTEWHPVLDRVPNLVRCSEWLEQTSGMNAHIKPAAFGNYIGIINLASSTVLQLCHDEDDVEAFTDEESPDGLRASKVVLHPGSLTILKHSARWSIPCGYSYETQHIFRRNGWPKDYRSSLMFSHYSKTSPGVATTQPNAGEVRDSYNPDAPSINPATVTARQNAPQSPVC